MYLYETHCHCSLSSACARLSPEQIVDLYVKNGYTGIFITDHFLSGNTTITEANFPNTSYEQKVRKFFDSYREVKKVAKNKLQVFPALEHSYEGTDILIYGLSEEQIIAMPEIMTMDLRNCIERLQKMGVLVVHAHPYREANYIDHIRLYPSVNVVETYNACRTDLCNELGKIYAKKYNKLSFGGSDIHSPNQKILSGMAFKHKLHSVADFVEAVKSGKGKIIKKKAKPIG